MEQPRCMYIAIFIIIILLVVYANKYFGFRCWIRRKPKFVMVYVDWCGFCTQAKPVFEEISNGAASNYFDFVKINGESEADMLSSVLKMSSVSRYPSYFVVDDNGITEVTTQLTEENVMLLKK